MYIGIQVSALCMQPVWKIICIYTLSLYSIIVYSNSDDITTAEVSMA